MYVGGVWFWEFPLGCPTWPNYIQGTFIRPGELRANYIQGS